MRSFRYVTCLEKSRLYPSLSSSQFMPSSLSVKELSHNSADSHDTGVGGDSSGWMDYINRLVGVEAIRSCKFAGRAIIARDRAAGARLMKVPEVEPVQEVALSGLHEMLPNDRQDCAVVLDGVLNVCGDMHAVLRELHGRLSRSSRVVCIVFNSYLRPLYALLQFLGLRTAKVPTTFLTFADLQDIAKASGFEVVRARPSGYVPWRLFGIGDLCNMVLPTVPLLRWAAYATVITLRPIQPDQGRPLLSVVVPVRNERGNVRQLFSELASLRESGLPLEAIFVEGHSLDGSLEELRAARDEWADRLPVTIERQPGEGKADAVRAGLALAQGELLTIFDADLTVDSSTIRRMYESYLSGAGEFINGSRLVYPHQPGAMRFLNTVGNVFFSKCVSAVLGIRLSDSLCGSKLFSRRDYARMESWRNDFAALDPFGDFDLLFAAADLGLEILNVPVRYESRKYGTTNIARFRHGLQLLKMVAIGFLRISMGTRVPRQPPSKQAQRQG